VYGGASMPIGDFKDQADIGFHVGAFGSTTLTGNLSVRLDAAYNNFGTKDFAATNATVSEKSNIIHTTLDAEYSLGAQTEMASGGGALPYISGGAGFYRFSFDDSCTGTGCTAFDLGSSSETHWGLNAGAGAVFFLSGFTPFVDVHFHTIFPKSGQTGRANMILASFGLKF
jgi:opacity protein-like surface antigen